MSRVTYRDCIGRTITVTVPPVGNVVTLDQVKTWLYIDGTDEDDLLNGLIAAAEDWVEGFLGVKLLDQELTFTADWFPGQNDNNNLSRSVLNENQRGGDLAIVLDYVPMTAVNSVSYIDASNTANPLVEDTDYTPVIAGPKTNGRVQPINRTWSRFADQRTFAACQVVYRVGYADADAVPDVIKTGIQMLISYMYNNRGECCGTCAMASGAKQILGPYKVPLL